MRWVSPIDKPARLCHTEKNTERMAPTMIKIVAKAKVKPDCKEKFIELAKPLVAASQAEEGNIAYHLHESLEDPYTMAFIEFWKDQAAIDFHNATPHFTSICPQFDALFDGPMDVAHFVEVV